MKAFLDVETTGFTPGQIAQLTYIITDDELNFVKAKNYYFSVDTMPQGATAVHGLTKVKLRKLSNDTGFFDHAREILDDLQECDMICHNTEFDSSFIIEEFHNIGLKPPKGFAACTMKYFTNICKLHPKRYGEYKWPKLEEVLKHTGISAEDVLAAAKSIFGCEDIGFHDSRFDATAVYLICSKGMDKEQFAEMQTAYKEVAAPRRQVAATAASAPAPVAAPKKKKSLWMTVWFIVSLAALFNEPWLGILSFAALSFVAYKKAKVSS